MLAVRTKRNFHLKMLKTYSEGDIVKENVEASGTAGQVLAHELRNHLTLRDELAGVELRNHALQNLVDNGRKHPLIVVGPQRSVDLR